MTSIKSHHDFGKKFVLASLFLSLFMFTTAITAQGAIIERLENGESLNIAVIGTSLTDANFNPQNWFTQMGTWLVTTYPGQVTLSNRAVSGMPSVNLPQYNRPYGGTWQLEQVLAYDNPDVIFMEFAINDAYKEFGISAADSGNNLKTLIDRAESWATSQGKTVEVIAQTMNNTGPSYAWGENDTGPYYQAWRDQAAASGVLLIDHSTNWVDLYYSEADHATWKSYVVDDIHPNTAGATAVILPEIQRVLTTQGQNPPPPVLVKTITMDTVPVGNAGNAGEASGGTVGDARTSGAVDYEYNIGKYEVKASQYTAFLNAVAASDPNGLYDVGMASTTDGCSILRNGTDGDYVYSVSDTFQDRSVNCVNYWDACRFANWMHNGQPTGGQDASTTEDGAYTLTTEGIADNTVVRNEGAIWAITSEDEWYKAAYHKNDGVTGNYWDYPAGSDTPMGNDVDDASGNNGNFAATSLMDVGTFVNSESPYGTFDQGGNVWEWTESIMHVYAQPTNLANRSLEGGTFFYDSSYSQAAYRIDGDPSTNYNTAGFRVVNLSTPIPGDANNDGKVDGSDVTILAGNWQYGVTGGGATWAMGDFNGDGKVDGSDVTILAGNWQTGVTAAATAVPEPGTVILLLSVIGSLLIWRWGK